MIIKQEVIGESRLIQGDCLDVMDKLIAEGVKVDAIVTDPPYGILEPEHKGKTHKKFYKDKVYWDYKINPQDIYLRSKKLLKHMRKLILFSQEPYTSELILNTNNNIKFNYRMNWNKHTFGSHLKCNKAPLSIVEDIVIFTNNQMDVKNNPYTEVINKYIDKYTKEYIIDLMFKEGRYSNFNSTKTHFSFKFGKHPTRLDLLDEKMYNFLIKYIDFKETYLELKNTFNKYKSKSIFNLNGEKYMVNLLNFKKDIANYHPTQKPIALMEYLIKTYTNEGELVLDFTAGSFSTGIASQNTNRRFIGIEKDEKYFNIGLERMIANDTIQE